MLNVKVVKLGIVFLKTVSLLVLFVLTTGFEYHLTIDNEGKFKVRAFKVETLSNTSLSIEDEVDRISLNVIAYSDFNNDGLEDILISVFWNDNEMGKTYDYHFDVLTKFSFDGVYIPIYRSDGKGKWRTLAIEKKDYLTKVLTGTVGKQSKTKLKLILDGEDLIGAYLKEHGRPEDLKILSGNIINKNSKKNKQFSLIEKSGGIETGNIKGVFEQLVTSTSNTKIAIKGVRLTNSDVKSEPFIFSSDYSGILKGVNFVDKIEFVDETYKGWYLNPKKEMTEKRDAFKFEYLPWNKPSENVKNKFPEFIVVDNCLDSVKYTRLEYFPEGPSIQWQMIYSACDLPELFRNASKPLKSYLSHKGQGNLVRDLLSRGSLALGFN
jgi:hypothetical protein